MASEFQRRKVDSVFVAMDTDRDGHLTEADFRALARRWTAVRGSAPDSAEHAGLTAIMMGWWEALAAAAGADRATQRDVLAVVDRLPEMGEAMTTTAHAMFDAIDQNGDAMISAAEYRQLIEVWNGRETDTDAVFPLLDLNGDGYVSRAEFTELWIEFWAGDDPDAAGSWVFGWFDRDTLS